MANSTTRPDTSSGSDIAYSGPADPAGGIAFCANHPTVETTLRCNRCGKPICTKCARLTPVGYRCPECIRGQQAAFFTAESRDYAIALAVALPLSLVCGFLADAVVTRLVWLVIFAGPFAGGIIADLTHRAIGRRRGRYIWLVVCLSIAVGALPFLASGLLGLVLLWLFGAPDRPGGAFALGLPLLDVGLMLAYVVLAIAAAYSRLRFGK